MTEFRIFEKYIIDLKKDISLMTDDDVEPMFKL